MKYGLNVTEEIGKLFPDSLFPSGYELIPNIREIYELQLAFYEYKLMSPSELVANSAYFSRIAGEYTQHFEMCAGEALRLPEHSSARLKSFFESNVFRTGYGTHGLFPYRGKFHPQMVKGLINMMGLQPGDVILDPMMGSGTVPVEASLMGIDSIGVDASRFCCFMTQAKVDALSMPLERIEGALKNFDDVYDYFQKKVGIASESKKRQISWDSYDCVKEDAEEYLTQTESSDRKKSETTLTYNLLLLAYLDSVGYSERSKQKSAKELFRGILERYLFVCQKAQASIEQLKMKLGRASVSTGDARCLDVDSDSVDGILFSPPYSFAIDYLENDAFHLGFFGVDAEDLKDRMIGLRGGRQLSDKYQCYRNDMSTILAECSRVLKKGSLCSIVIGTNDNQLSKALRIPREQVQGLHDLMIELGDTNGMERIKLLERSIHGMSNTMRKEYIVILQKA
jgi:DNA modification methylase